VVERRDGAHQEFVAILTLAVGAYLLAYPLAGLLYAASDIVAGRAHLAGYELAFVLFYGVMVPMGKGASRRMKVRFILATACIC
jgi:hypothetical protein